MIIETVNEMAVLMTLITINCVANVRPIGYTWTE